MTIGDLQDFVRLAYSKKRGHLRRLIQSGGVCGLPANCFKRGYMKSVFMMALIVKRPTAVLNMPRKNPGFITKAKSINKAIADNTGGFFAVLPVNPTVLQIVIDIDSLDTAQTAALTRAGKHR